jgi:hypothetical protein
MGIGGKCKDNIYMADFDEYVALYVCILCTLILRRRLNWTNELVNDLIDLVEEIEVIWNAKAKVYHDKDKRKEAILFFDIWTDLL